MSFADFRPAALARTVAAIGRTYHVPASRIDYAVLIRNPATRGLQWLVYPKGGAGHFQADGSGGSLRRVG